MNLPRYKFSKESEPALLEFLKVVAVTKPSNDSKTCKLWEEILPMDEELRQQLNTIKNETEVNERVSKNKDIEDVMEVQCDNEEKFLVPDQSFIQLTLHESKRNVSMCECLSESIHELLEMESSVSNDVIRQLGSECTKYQLKQVFTTLADNLNSQCITNLWKSICTAACEERAVVANCFFEDILGQLICNGHDQKIKALLNEVYSNDDDSGLSNKLIDVLLKLLLEQNRDSSNWSSLKHSLILISSQHKKILLREFTKQCAKFEEHHLDVYANLLTKDLNFSSSFSTNHTISNDAILISLEKLVDLMYEVAKEYEINRSFGKLLLDIMQVLACYNYSYFEKIKHMIVLHNSVYKSLLMKECNKMLIKQQGFSQTLEKIVQ